MAEQQQPSSEGVSLADLPKSWTFTSALPADPLFQTPADSHATPRDRILPRQVRGALFTWVRPAKQQDPELLCVSPAAMRTLGLAPSEASTDEFRQTAAGNLLHGWQGEEDDDSTSTASGSASSGPRGYPWAQCYGGFQFGQWAGQLGDGRAISLFEATNPSTGQRFEVQLKGAGITPYSRFADGKAVLRSSIREFVASEALAALGIPTTRALALTLLPHSRVRRETMEPGAIVVRLAQSWVRLGTFDLLRARGDRALTRRLATYVAEEVLGGWAALPARLPDDDPSSQPGGGPSAAVNDPPRRVPATEVQGPDALAENRFARLYREVVRRNARTVARWQAYGFTNGVLNTDNTSVLGLSIDFGPFAFLDNFDPSYTPNHDDHLLRYSYRNQPTVIWWNLVRFGEALGELMGAGARVDEEDFVENGIKVVGKGEEGEGEEDEEETDALVSRAEGIITRAGEEYKAVFLAEYKRLMTARLGLRSFGESDFEDLFSGLLDAMESLELDFHLFFRRLSSVRMGEVATEEAAREKAAVFFYREGVTGAGGEEEGRRRVGDWLCRWRDRIVEDWGTGEEPGGSSPAVGVSEERETERIEAMKRVNPSFVPRGWILDEVIRRVEREGERDVLRRITHMALHPFEDGWHGRTFDGELYEGDEAEETRWTRDVPRTERALQCSCSS